MYQTTADYLYLLQKYSVQTAVATRKMHGCTRATASGSVPAALRRDPAPG